MASNIDLIYSSGAKEWKNLNRDEISCEKRIKIASIAGGLIVLVGSLIAIYFLLKTSTLENKILATAIAGLGLSVFLIGKGIFYNLEEVKYKPGSISEEKLREFFIGNFLVSLPEFTKNISKLGPAVRKGFFTVEEGNQIRELFVEYGKKTYHVEYLRINVPEWSKKENPKTMEDARKIVRDLEAKWETMKGNWKILKLNPTWINNV